MPQVLIFIILFLVSAPAFVGAETIFVLGDSLTAGLGVKSSEAWPSLLEKRLKAAGYDVQLVNAGVSGDTTAGGRSRLKWSLEGGGGLPDVAIVALGGNDALRGFETLTTRSNLDAILTELKTLKIRILLAGMWAPPNLGEEYGIEFAAIYTDLAAKHKVPLYPFILDGVAAVRSLNQADGIHPNALGHTIIARRIEPYVIKLLTLD